MSRLKDKFFNLPDALRKRRKLERDLSIFLQYHAGVRTVELCRAFRLNRSQVCKIIREISRYKKPPKLSKVESMIGRSVNHADSNAK